MSSEKLKSSSCSHAVIMSNKICLKLKDIELTLIHVKRGFHRELGYKMLHKMSEL